MTNDTIYLDADLFMAIGLSAEAHGGIGGGTFANKRNLPVCAYGHECWLGLYGGFGVPIASLGDARLRAAGIRMGRRISFAEWCRIVNVDVAR